MRHQPDHGDGERQVRQIALTFVKGDAVPVVVLSFYFCGTDSSGDPIVRNC